MLLKGVHITQIISIFLHPVHRILKTLFSSMMLNVYATGITMYIMRLLFPFVKELFDLFDKRKRQLNVLRKSIERAPTAHVWKELAKKYVDTLKQINKKTGKKTMSLYDKLLLQEALHFFQSQNNVQETMNHLRFELVRNVANIAKNKLHEHYLVIPNTILRYTTSIKGQLKTIFNDDSITHEEKIKFFRDVRQIYGRTALLLSGGASYGTFHLGVVKALFEHGLLPRIIAGTSVGSIVAAIVCVRTNDELKNSFLHLDELDIAFFNESETVKLLKNFLKHGHAYDDSYLIKKLKTVIGEYTFEEAFNRTGRILNITVTAANTNESARVLNYMTSPHIYIWSAVAASAAFPGLFPSQFLYGKSQNGEETTVCGINRKWIDGAMEMDLPMSSLSELFNCNYFIVSQCAPHVAPILNMKRLIHPHLGQFIEDEIKYRCKQLYSFIKSKWLKLFTQTWEGDITITIPLSYCKPNKLIYNPSIHEIFRMVKVGERCGWQHLWAIDCNCSIEAYLDECVKKLDRDERNASWGIQRALEKMSLEEIYCQELSNIIEEGTGLDFIAP